MPFFNQFFNQFCNQYSSGLIVEELVIGRGETAALGNEVLVHFVGRLAGRPPFDSTRERRAPFDFALGSGDVIEGWDQGVQGMRVGGKRRLTIPPALAYAERGCGALVPPHATLVFEVELLQVS